MGTLYNDPLLQPHWGEAVPVQVCAGVREGLLQLQRQSQARADSQGPGELTLASNVILKCKVKGGKRKEDRF